MIIWAPIEACNQEELHAFWLDGCPGPVCDMQTLCGIQSIMNLVLADFIKDRCEICEHHAVEK